MLASCGECSKEWDGEQNEMKQWMYGEIMMVKWWWSRWMIFFLLNKLHILILVCCSSPGFIAALQISRYMTSMLCLDRNAGKDGIISLRTPTAWDWTPVSSEQGLIDSFRWSGFSEYQCVATRLVIELRPVVDLYLVERHNIGPIDGNAGNSGRALWVHIFCIAVTHHLTDRYRIYSIPPCRCTCEPEVLTSPVDKSHAQCTADS